MQLLSDEVYVIFNLSYLDNSNLLSCSLCANYKTTLSNEKKKSKESVTRSAVNGLGSFLNISH